MINLNSVLNVGELAALYRARIEYSHLGESLSGAFCFDEEISIKIFLPRKLAVISTFLEIFSDSNGKSVARLDGELIDSENGFDTYGYSLPSRTLNCGLYFASAVFESCNTVYFAEYESCGDIVIREGLAAHPSLQLTVYSHRYQEPKKLFGGIIYQIFVDRFNRGGKSAVDPDDVLIDGEWDVIAEYPEYPGAPMKNNSFFGGTLWGVIDKLDYISSLGVDTIYLTPIFESPSNHRYDTADYLSVDGMLGGEEALRALIFEAEQRGISIILDAVFNHTGSDSIYFNKYSRYDSVGAYQSEDSPYYNWYKFYNYPYSYECWWNIDILPRINPDEDTLCDFFTGERGVVNKYAAMGVYGLRLDVVDELSDSFVRKVRETLNRAGESVLYGEVWEDASNKIAYGKRKEYYIGAELDGVMNYPLRRGIIDYVMNKNVSLLRYALTDIINNAPERIANLQMNLLGTHDTERILTVLSGESGEGLPSSCLQTKRISPENMNIAVARLKAAYTVIATLPGIPMVFYGDEAGLEGYSDPFNRMPYPWGRENKDIVQHYRRVGRIRRESSIYKKGAFRILRLDSDLLVFKRYDRSRTYVTAFNNSNNEVQLEFNSSVTELLSNKKGRHLTVPPWSAIIIRLTEQRGRSKEGK